MLFFFEFPIPIFYLFSFENRISLYCRSNLSLFCKRIVLSTSYIW